ncbi:MAG: tRNA (cmo5U34)-methyltransferase [Chloroflexota bacterium]|jgi:tRNA (cmo5U34)-methyltransferase|nr:tRNA (cmo5U34)-methyltransferase [Chloroflexota bacterium]
MALSAPSDDREDWFDADFVDDWLRRQEARGDERHHQFSMLRSLFLKEPNERFSYLDIGAGDGALDESILGRYHGAQATLLDGSPVMVERAQQRLKPFGGQVRVVQGDLSTAAWTEAAGGPFDVVVSTIALHNLEDPRRLRALYGEVCGLVAPGGMFMNLDYMRAPSRSVWPIYQGASKDPEGSWKMGVRSMREYAGSVDEHLGWLSEAGFAPVDCFWREFRLAIVAGLKSGS